MRNIKTLCYDELVEFIRHEKEPDYRARQIWEWIYQRAVTSFDQMHNLPHTLREKLNSIFFIYYPRIEKIQQAEDGTQKLFIALEDGCGIETVIIPDKKRITMCISTQVGCKQGCKFCLTGRAGFTRNLYHYEICDQIALAQSRLKARISNIVLMGMGEPLDNYENTMHALHTILSPFGFSFPSKRVTLSTVGLVPYIKKLSEEHLNINLAISLNAGNDTIRNSIMPINKKYPLFNLIKCIRAYPLKSREKITIEYVVIGTINDSALCAEQLSQLLKNCKIKINLIPYNNNLYLPFHAPTEEAILKFFTILKNHNYNVTIRESKGADILAACGQLGYLS
ncbi:MAG: 23S rRNA (adenine(2503)-C(2))-methyltransferase RlmN [bacterium]